MDGPNLFEAVADSYGACFGLAQHLHSIRIPVSEGHNALGVEGVDHGSFVAGLLGEGDGLIGKVEGWLFVVHHHEEPGPLRQRKCQIGTRRQGFEDADRFRGACVCLVVSSRLPVEANRERQGPCQGEVVTQGAIQIDGDHQNPAGGFFVEVLFVVRPVIEDSDAILCRNLVKMRFQSMKMGRRFPVAPHLHRRPGGLRSELDDGVGVVGLSGVVGHAGRVDGIC